jgi:hypothetical protein
MGRHCAAYLLHKFVLLHSITAPGSAERPKIYPWDDNGFSERRSCLDHGYFNQGSLLVSLLVAYNHGSIAPCQPSVL